MFEESGEAVCVRIGRIADDKMAIRYWAGKPGERRLSRRHYACGHRSPNDGGLPDGLTWACPPSARPKTPYSDSVRLRIDYGLSAAFGSGPMHLVSREPGAVHVETPVGFLLSQVDGEGGGGSSGP